MKKKLIYIISLAILIMGIFNGVSFADHIGIVGETVKADPGSTVSINYTTVGVTSSNKLGGLQASVGELPTGISLKGISSSVESTKGNSSIAILSGIDGITNNVVITLTLEVSTAVEGGKYDIPLNVSALADIDANDYAENCSATLEVIKELQVTPMPTISPTSTPTSVPTATPEKTPNNPSEPKSSDSSLGELIAQASGKVLNVTKNSNKYTTTVEANVNAVTFTVKAGSKKATIDSDKSTRGISFVRNNEASGEKTYTMSNLNDGSNVIKIAIIAEDGSTSNYNFVVTKKVSQNEEVDVVPNIIDESNEQNDNNEEKIENEGPEKNVEPQKDVLTLKNLLVTGAELSPSFNTNTYLYNVVLVEAENAEVVAVPTNAEASVEIFGNKNLVLGENLITVLLKMNDETKTYQIIVTNEEYKPPVLATEEGIEIGEVMIGWKHIAIIALGIFMFTVVVMVIVHMSRKTIDDNIRKDKLSHSKENINSTTDKNVAADDTEHKDVGNTNENNYRKGKRFK